MSTAKSRDLQSANAKNIQLQSDLAAVRQELLNSQINMRESLASAAELRKQLDESSESCVSLREQNQEMTLELEQRAACIEAEKATCETTMQERDSLISKANSLRNEVEKLTIRTQSLEKIVQSSATDLLEAQDAKEKLSIAKASADNKASHLSASLNELKQSNHMLENKGKLAIAQISQKLADQENAAKMHLTGLADEVAAAKAHAKVLEAQLQDRTTDNRVIQKQLTQCQSELATSRQHITAQTKNSKNTSVYKNMDFSSHVEFSKSDKDVRIRADWWKGEMRIDIREFYSSGAFTKKVSWQLQFASIEHVWT
jgi:chromosome segregation ATPase